MLNANLNNVTWIVMFNRNFNNSFPTAPEYSLPQHFLPENRRGEITGRSLEVASQGSEVKGRWRNVKGRSKQAQTLK